MPILTGQATRQDQNPDLRWNPMSAPPSSAVRDLLALHLVPGLGPRLTTALLQRFGSAGAALQATAEQLQEVPHIGAKIARGLRQSMQRVDVDAELALMEKTSVRLLVRGQDGFPKSLEEIPDPPHLLYVRGTLQEGDSKAVALVGSRACTSYGRKVAERLAGELTRAGYTVISGLARGIDGMAHRGALKAGGRTLAVLAGGLSRIYPPEHTDLANEVAAAGAILTESSMRMEPMAVMFPARNRLISGLSRGVVVIEAAERSGALITASHAAEQGLLDSPASAGVHQLLRKGAVLVRGVEDILEELEGVRPTVEFSRPAPPPVLDETQRRIWDFLAGQSKHVDDLAQQLGLSVPEITGALFRMEMKKIVRRLPGNQYERT
jgi:DNA processing protein